MYPDDKNPYFGVFVKRNKEQLSESFTVEKIVLNKQKSLINKVCNYIRHYMKIYRIAQHDRFDLLYVHYVSHNSLPLLFISKKKLKNKLILNFHGSDAMPERKIQVLFQPVVKKIINNSKSIVVPSNYFKNEICKKYFINPNKVFVSPSSGINTQLFRENNKKNYHKFGLSSKHKYIGFVGRISEGKGWDDFLEAIKILKRSPLFTDKYKFIIVGDGPQLKELKKRISSLDIENDIRLLGLQSQENLNEIYNLLDLFVFPSKRKGESLGLVGLEAMACGVPVLGAKTGGISEYVIDKITGFCYDPGNNKQLSRKMSEYIKLSIGEKEIMKRKCVEKANEYKYEHVRDLLNNYLRKVAYEKK